MGGWPGCHALMHSTRRASGRLRRLSWPTRARRAVLCAGLRDIREGVLNEEQNASSSSTRGLGTLGQDPTNLLVDSKHASVITVNFIY